MTTPKDIRNWQIDINNSAAIVEGVNDIIQCIYIILTTIPGSDPLRPDFGSNVYKFIDKSANEVQGQLIYAAKEAIKKWEKRINVTKCTLITEGIGIMAIQIEGDVVATAEQTAFTVPLK